MSDESATEAKGHNARPLFSVVMPAFNASRTLGRAVTSVLAQTIDDFELIVVDDGSHDEGATAAVVESLREPRLRIIRQDNAGVTSARNAGAELARGQFLTFLDADDEAVSDWLETFARVLHPVRAPLARCAALVHRGDRAELLRAEPFDAVRLCPRGSPCPGTFAVERGLFADVGRFDARLRFAENTELLLRLAIRWREQATWTVPLVARALVIVHQASGRAIRYGSEPRRSAELILERHARALAQDPEILHDYAAIVGTDELRHGQRREAVRWFMRSLRAKPTLRGALRLARCALPQASLRAIDSLRDAAASEGRRLA